MQDRGRAEYRRDYAGSHRDFDDSRRGGGFAGGASERVLQRRNKSRAAMLRDQVKCLELCAALTPANILAGRDRALATATGPPIATFFDERPFATRSHMHEAFHASTVHLHSSSNTGYSLGADELSAAVEAALDATTTLNSEEKKLKIKSRVGGAFLCRPNQVNITKSRE